MEKKTISVCVMVGIMGIAAAIAGFAAEATKVGKSQITVVDDGSDLYCEYPSSPDKGFAICAMVALVLAWTIITSVSGGCCSCCYSIPDISKFARPCIILSWIASFIAIILFVVGVLLSTPIGVEIEATDEFYCTTLRPGIFAGAGIMGLLSVVLHIVYYLFYVSAVNGTTSAVDLELAAPPITNVK